VGEHVGADQDAALHLGAEALGPALGVHVVQAVVLRGAIAVAHAVEAGQVGAGLGRGDDVVGRHRQLHVGQAHFHHLGTEGLVLLDGGLDGGHHGGVTAFAEELLGQADLEAGQGLGGSRGVQFPGVVLHRAFQAGGILGVEAGHGVEQEAAILGGAGHGAGLVEGGGEGDHAPAGNHAVGGLQAGEVAQGGGLADGAAGVGAGGGGGQAGRHGGGGTAGGAAGNAALVPGVLHRAEEGGFVGGAHGELVHIGLAQVHGAGGVEFLDHRGVVGADEVGQHLGATGGEPALSAEDVLLGQGDAGQGAGVASGKAGVGRLGLGQGALRLGGDVGVDGRVEPVDAVQIQLGQLDAGDLLAGQGLGEFFKAGIEHGR